MADSAAQQTCCPVCRWAFDARSEADYLGHTGWADDRLLATIAETACARIWLRPGALCSEWGYGFGQASCVRDGVAD